MKRLLTVAAIFVGSALISAQSAAADDAELIKSAEAAAPAAVSSGATIYAWGEGGAMKTLREGTNGYWCMPNDSSVPGADSSMCGDANAMDWLMAIVTKKEPPKGKVGLVYMLAGVDMAPSNLDPYLTEPPEGSDYVKTGPHIMIVNAMDQLQGYTGDANPDTTKPYVMYPNTPYAHIMYPVE
jgi:hypothetical protein